MKYEYMTDLIKAAKAAGYSPIANGKLSLIEKCPDCGKKAVVLTPHIGDVTVVACVCGYRHKK